MAGGPSNRAMVMVNPSPAGMSENGQEPADDIVYTPEVPQKADPIAAVRPMEKVCHKRNRAFTDHRAAGGFLASLAPAVAANHSGESPAAAVATTISAKSSSRSRLSLAPALCASPRIGQLLRVMTILSVLMPDCSAHRLQAASRSEPTPCPRQSAATANAA